MKPWLSESVHGETYFYCKFCKKDYKSGKSEVFKHMSSMKHKKNITQPPSEKIIKKVGAKLKIYIKEYQKFYLNLANDEVQGPSLSSGHAFRKIANEGRVLRTDQALCEIPEGLWS